MKFVSVGPVPFLLTFFLFVPLNGLTACGGHRTPVLPYTLSVSPQPGSIPVNGGVTFTATTNGPNDNVDWVLLGYADSGANEGSPHSAFGTTFAYTAPPTPPIYFAPTIPQGSVPLQVSEGETTVQFNIAITAPSITTGFFEVSANTVALGKTLGIGAYAVGSTNNAVTMQVNGITGGSTTCGTITPNNVGLGSYIYTAPATMPMTGNTVTVTVISVADPTKSSSMTITLTS